MHGNAVLLMLRGYQLYAMVDNPQRVRLGHAVDTDYYGYWGWAPSTGWFESIWSTGLQETDDWSLLPDTAWANIPWSDPFFTIY